MEKSTHGEGPREEAERAEAASTAAYRANTRILDPALFSDIAPARGEERTRPAATEGRAPSERTALRPPAAKAPSPVPTSASRPARRALRRGHLLFAAAAALVLASFAVLRLQREEPLAPTATPIPLDPTSTIGEPSREVVGASPAANSVPASATVVAGSAAGPSAETPAPVPAFKSAPGAARKTAGAAPNSPAPATAAAATPPAAAGTLVFPND